MTSLTQDPAHPDTWIIPSYYEGDRLIQEPVVIRGVHLSATCAGQVCIMHNPSNHHMRRWPLLWDDDRQVFGRLCPHQYKHPDPDSWGSVDHSEGSACDGCCQRF